MRVAAGIGVGGLQGAPDGGSVWGSQRLGDEESREDLRHKFASRS